MYCNNCGSKNYDNERFCGNCGMPLEKKPMDNMSSIEELKKAEKFTNIIVEKTPLSLSPNDNNSTPYNNKYQSVYHQKSKKNSFSSTMMTIGIFLILIGLTLTFINRNDLFNNYSGKRTIMIYMVGSDLESKYASASKDIKEMVDSDLDFENINVLIYTGGTQTWHTAEGISSEENAIYKVGASGLEKLQKYEIMDMGDSATLLSFLNYAYNNYKAEKYSLIFWDHGGGPIYGYGYDEYNKTNPLTLLEMENALEKSAFSASNKLEFIGFDACLMATAEIAYKLSDYADYMIASQEVEPGDGWNYSFLSNISKDTSTYDIGKSIIDSYSEYYENRISVRGISLSLLRLNKIDSLEQKLNSLFEDIDQDLVIDFSNISRSRSNSKTFGKVTSTGYDLVDLYDLLDKLPEKYYEKVNSLKSAIEDLVVYQQTDLTGANGISIYFPYENKKQISEIMYLYKMFDFAEEYTSFIDNFSSTLTGTRLYNWNLESTTPTEKETGVIEIELPQEIAENYSSASYTIFEKIDDNYYMPRFKGTDISLNGNTLSTAISKKALVVTGSDGEETYITAIESESGTDYTKYIIPGTLQRWQDDFMSGFEMIAVYFQFIVDEENPNGKIAGAIELTGNEENNVSPKVSVNIEEWNVLQLLNYKYKIFDENGNYTTNWVSSPEVTGFETEITEKFSVELKDLDISKEYYAVFRVADSQGNIYTTNVVKVLK